MWQKLVAGIFVMIGSSGFGAALCKDMSSEIEELKVEKQILSYIMGEIAYIHRPLEEIFDILSERIETPFDELLRRIADKMRSRSGKSVTKIWQEEMKAWSVEYRITGRCIGYLERIPYCFECEGDNIQVETLELLRNEIDLEIENLLERKKENSRLIRVLSTLAGVLCIVLFL
jgi:stage III sporulation protein AB